MRHTARSIALLVPVLILVAFSTGHDPADPNRSAASEDPQAPMVAGISSPASMPAAIPADRSQWAPPALSSLGREWDIRALSVPVVSELNAAGETVLSPRRSEPGVSQRSWVVTLGGESLVMPAGARLVLPSRSSRDPGAARVQARVEGTRWVYRVPGYSRIDFSENSGGLQATSASPHR